MELWKKYLLIEDSQDLLFKESFSFYLFKNLLSNSLFSNLVGLNVKFHKSILQIFFRYVFLTIWFGRKLFENNCWEFTVFSTSKTSVTFSFQLVISHPNKLWRTKWITVQRNTSFLKLLIKYKKCIFEILIQILYIFFS